MELIGGNGFSMGLTLWPWVALVAGVVWITRARAALAHQPSAAPVRVESMVVAALVVAFTAWHLFAEWATPGWHPDGDEYAGFPAWNQGFFDFYGWDTGRPSLVFQLTIFACRYVGGLVALQAINVCLLVVAGAALIWGLRGARTLLVMPTALIVLTAPAWAEGFVFLRSYPGPIAMTGLAAAGAMHASHSGRPGGFALAFAGLALASMDDPTIALMSVAFAGSCAIGVQSEATKRLAIATMTHAATLTPIALGAAWWHAGGENFVPDLADNAVVLFGGLCLASGGATIALPVRLRPIGVMATVGAATTTGLMLIGITPGGVQRGLHLFIPAAITLILALEAGFRDIHVSRRLDSATGLAVTVALAALIGPSRHERLTEVLHRVRPEETAPIGDAAIQLAAGGPVYLYTVGEWVTFAYTETLNRRGFPLRNTLPEWSAIAPFRATLLDEPTRNAQRTRTGASHAR